MMKPKKSTKKASLPKAAQRLREADPHYEEEIKKYPQPLPSRSYLLDILTERGAPTYPEELVEMFAIQPDEAEFFSRRLNAMAREGEVVINRKGAICIAEKLDLIKGRVQGHADGFGFVVPDDGSDDLFISPKEMHKVLHGDRVMARQIGVDRRGRREGKIVEVLEHVNSRLVGRLFVERGVRYVRAEEKRINQEILLTPEGNIPAQPGQVVTVELVSQPSKYGQPIGRIVEVLGNYADPGMEIEIALRKHDLPHVFSYEAEAQAKKTPSKVQKKDWQTPEGLEREDLRDMPLVTIDGETARDFDDAVFAERSGKGWRLVVAIADVSHYVRPRDALDQTGIERGNSVYFPRRVIPMLPEQLSNGICSLNPDVERCCMVCDMEVTAKGEVKKYRFYPAVMLSKARFTYTEVWEILQAPAGKAAKARKGLVPHLETLYELFQVLLKQRQIRGAIDFETTETQMIFNEVGKIERIEPVTRNNAHRLIEECMLAANVCAADYLGANKHTALYRVHEGPTERKLENLRRFLNERGLSLGGGDDPQAKDYAALMEQVKGRPDTGLLQTMLLRSMQQAVYSPERLGHFGLAYDAYTHFTSPIRRYPDLLVHRAIKAVLAGTTYKPGSWEEIGARCSMTERRADEATRDVENWLKCYFMRDRLGEVFEGVVSAVTSFGLFVLLDGLFVEGLVHISELGTDYFHYDESSHSLRGERTGKSFGLTEKVARVDLETSKIDFALVDNTKSESAPGFAKGNRQTKGQASTRESPYGNRQTRSGRGGHEKRGKLEAPSAPRAPQAPAPVAAPAKVSKPLEKPLSKHVNVPVPTPFVANTQVSQPLAKQKDKATSQAKTAPIAAPKKSTPPATSQGVDQRTTSKPKVAKPAPAKQVETPSQKPSRKPAQVAALLLAPFAKADDPALKLLNKANEAAKPKAGGKGAVSEQKSELESTSTKRAAKKPAPAPAAAKASVPSASTKKSAAPAVKSGPKTARSKNKAE
jgi:ribonuclease R